MDGSDAICRKRYYQRTFNEQKVNICIENFYSEDATVIKCYAPIKILKAIAIAFKLTLLQWMEHDMISTKFTKTLTSTLSRRQNDQLLGRILRPQKPRPDHTLVDYNCRKLDGAHFINYFAAFDATRSAVTKIIGNVTLRALSVNEKVNFLI